MMFQRGGDGEEEQEAPDILYSSAEMKRRRQMEKQLKKFQKIQNKQNVREYEENFHTKNYTNICSKVFQLRERKYDNGNDKVVANEKVLINRRVLNDYIHIVNKRQDVVDSMEDNFWTMVQLYDGTLHYFNKYYGKKLEDQTNKLNKMLKPEHRYLLKNIDRNEARIKRRILEYEQVKNSSDPRLKKALQECKNIDQIVERNQEAQKQRIIERRNKNNSEGRIEKLSKKKGYIVNEMDVEQRRQNQIVMNEVQKFGSDRIKRKLFEQDMKVILENQGIQDKIHQIQMSLDKMNALQGSHQPQANKQAHSSSSHANHNEDTQKFSSRNNPPSLQHIKMVTPRSPNLDFQASYPANQLVASAMNSPYNNQNELMNIPLDESIFNRRHSHNNLNPFLAHNHNHGLQKQIDSPKMKSAKELNGLSKSVDKLSLNSIDEQDKDDPTQKKQLRSSLFNMKQSQKKPSFNSQQFISTHLTLREQNFKNKQHEPEKFSMNKLRVNSSEVVDFISPNSTPSNGTQMKSHFIFDNISQINKLQQGNTIESSGLNTPNSNNEKKIRSVVSFVLPSNELSNLTPQRLSQKNDKQTKSTASTSFNSVSESKFKYSQMNASVGPFTTSNKEQKKQPVKQNQSQQNLQIRKASLDFVMGKSNTENSQKLGAMLSQNTLTKEQIQVQDKVQAKQQLTGKEQQFRASKSNLLTPLKPALKKSQLNIVTSEVMSSTNLKTQDTFLNNQQQYPCSSNALLSQSQLQLESADKQISESIQVNSDQSISVSQANLLTSESPTKNNINRTLIKRLTTLVPSDSLAIGNLISKHKISKSMQLNSENMLSYNHLEDNNNNTDSAIRTDDKIHTLEDEDIDEDENEDEENTSVRKEGQRRRDTLKTDKRKKSMVEILGKKPSQTLDKLNSQQTEQVFEKPLIRNKIYNENDLFKYKKINQFAIQEIYEKRILNLHKDEAPLLTVSELQEIEEKQKKSLQRLNSTVSHSKHFSWNNLEEKKADFLSLEKQRSLYINPEQEENFEKKITKLHGSDIFEKYKDIQKNCMTHLEHSKSFQRDIKDGQSEFKQKHLVLKQQYADHLGPKEYKSKYVKEILDQTKRQLNFKIKNKTRSLISSPEKILSNLLKKDKQTWGKTIQNQSANKDENISSIFGQSTEKKFNMFQSQTPMTEGEKKQQRNKSMEQLEKIVDKYKQSSHSQSLQEQLNSLMSLDTKRKALFEMTQKMYQPNSFHKHKQKNKYLNGVLSTTNIDTHTFQDFKSQIHDKKINQSTTHIVSPHQNNNHSDNSMDTDH